MDHRVVTTGLGFPEGPVAMPDGSVLLVEIAHGRLTSVAPDGSQRVVAEPGGGPNGAAIGPDGKAYLCNNGGFEWRVDADGSRHMVRRAKDAVGRIERVDLATGRVEVLYDRTDVAPLSAPNDIVFDRHGGFYFTDLGAIHDREVGRGRVCYAKADGSSIREVVFPMWMPNGIGLSPDEKTLYVAETVTARVWAFDIAAPGELALLKAPAPTPGRLLWGSSHYCRFDSLAVEASGNVCVATLSTGGITVVSPEGKLVEYRPLPDPTTTNICFGGPDLRTAYVTLSGLGQLVTMPWARPGLALNYLNK